MNFRVNNQPSGRIDYANENLFLGYQAGGDITAQTAQELPLLALAALTLSPEKAEEMVKALLTFVYDFNPMLPSGRTLLEMLHDQPARQNIVRLIENALRTRGTYTLSLAHPTITGQRTLFDGKTGS